MTRKRKASPKRRGKPQLGSLAAWLASQGISRTRFGPMLGHDRAWCGELLRGEVRCSLKEGGKIAHETGLDLVQLARECSY